MQTKRKRRRFDGVARGSALGAWLRRKELNVRRAESEPLRSDHPKGREQRRGVDGGRATQLYKMPCFAMGGQKPPTKPEREQRGGGKPRPAPPDQAKHHDFVVPQGWRGTSRPEELLIAAPPYVRARRASFAFLVFVLLVALFSRCGKFCAKFVDNRLTFGFVCGIILPEADASLSTIIFPSTALFLLGGCPCAVVYGESAKAKKCLDHLRSGHFFVLYAEPLPRGERPAERLFRPQAGSIGGMPLPRRCRERGVRRAYSAPRPRVPEPSGARRAR